MYLGIDIGTSAIKAVLIDASENLLAETDTALSLSRPHPLWSEQNPADWWQAVDAALLALREQAAEALSRVEGIGLSGQMHGAAVLGANDQPLRPAILWNDGRSQAQCTELEQRVPGLPLKAGVVAMPGLTAPKLLWLRQHEPEVFKAIRSVLLPKDYVRLRLSGERISDLSDAAGTLWLDQAERDWNDEALAACGLERSQMPRLVEGSAPGGYLRAEIAQRWGMRPGIVIAGGGGDAAAGGVGIGAVNDGDGFLSLGTSGQFFVATERYQPKPEVLLHSFAHCIPQRWFQMAAMLNGASCLAWAANIVQETDIDALLKRVEAAYQGPSSILFLPYLSGERTPHNNPHARGVLFGLNANNGSVDVVQAVMEGVAFSFADAHACLLQAGSDCTQPGVIGGGARSRFWIQMLADVLGRPLQCYKGGAKGPAFGAARLARLAAHGESPETLCRRPEVSEVIAPRPHYTERYAARVARFRSLYHQLKNEFN